MKKVLIITYYFPPDPTIGAQRPFKIAKYLKLYGWEPIILTTPYSGQRPNFCKIIEVVNKRNILQKKHSFLKYKKVAYMENDSTLHRYFVKKFKKLIKELIYYPDDKKAWIAPAVNTTLHKLNHSDLHAIISTSYPTTTHLVAEKLKRKLKIPWIADLRDPWTQNEYVQKYRIIKFFEKKLEKKTFSKADLLVTVTPNWVEDLKKLHRNKEIVYIPNGYDEDDYQNGEPVELTKKFTLTYTGQLYEGKRDPSMLFEVVSELIKRNVLDESLIEIRFFGPEERWLEERIKKYNLERVVKIYGFVSRQEAIRRQMESQVLLLLLWNNEYEKGVCPGKVYEYFAARRPIIATGGPGGVVKDLITETNTGRYIMEKKELESAISDYYEEYIKTGQVHYRGNGKITHYNYKKITERYAEVLERIVDGSWVNE